MNELIAGVRSDLAIKIFGDDLDVLRQKADEVVAAVSRIPGASGFKAQQGHGLPVLQIVVEPERIARYGINAADVMTVVETLGGAEATQILEGQRRFTAWSWFPESVRRDTRRPSATLLVSAPGGERVPARLAGPHRGAGGAGGDQPRERLPPHRRGGQRPRPRHRELRGRRRAPSSTQGR